MLVSVIGGAGYLGAQIARLLCERGHRVDVIDNLEYGSAGLRDIKADLNLRELDMAQLRPVDLQGSELVINCGGLSNDPTADWDPRENWRQNFHAVLHTADVAKESGVSRFVFASTCSIYDGSPSQEASLTEQSTVCPVGHYSQAKHAAEKALSALASDRFGVVCLRMGTLFGASPRMRFDLVVNAMVRSALTRGYIEVAGNGELWRPMLGVKDAARAYADFTSTAPQSPFEIYNLVGDNCRISEIAQYVQLAAQSANCKADVRSAPLPARIRSYRADGEKAASHLGFESQVSVLQGAREVVEHCTPMDHDALYDPVFENIRWLQQRADRSTTNAAS